MSKIEKNGKKPSTSTQNTGLYTLGLSDVGLAGVKKKKVLTGFSTWIRVLMQNWRQGTVGCKGRSDVNRTNKKPWKQKGTGRARAGSARSPVWRGGGIVFGPQPRVRTLTVSQKLKKTVLRNLFMDYVERGKVVVADWHVAQEKPSTAMAAKFLKSAGLEDKKVMLFLPWADTLSRSSFTNIQSVNVVFADQVNAYDMSTSDTVLVLKRDLENFKEMVSKWS